MFHAHFPTPFGIMHIQASTLGLRSVQWTDKKEGVSIPVEMEEYVSQLQAYFERKRTQFDIPLDWSGAGEFDQKVWAYLQTIPYGKTVSYSHIATELGDPKLVRAVGGSNARNPIPVIVPCHRVIGKNGALTGFAYGLDMKAKLLGLERPMDFAEQASLF